MNSLILRATARLLITLLMMFSMVLLFRGHDAPGGGFSGGLVATTAWALYSLAFGAQTTRVSLKYDPHSLMGCGLILSLLSGVLPLFLEEPFLTGLWFDLPLGGGHFLKVGTPLIFDIGVYLVILGFALNIILSIEEEEA
jgi:multicomponent Na+:H+ antiporter subunit B